jgi:hypothetical protein
MEIAGQEQTSVDKENVAEVVSAGRKLLMSFR